MKVSLISGYVDSYLECYWIVPQLRKVAIISSIAVTVIITIAIHTQIYVYLYKYIFKLCLFSSECHIWFLIWDTADGLLIPQVTQICINYICLTYMIKLSLMFLLKKVNVYIIITGRNVSQTENGKIMTASNSYSLYTGKMLPIFW